MKKMSVKKNEISEGIYEAFEKFGSSRLATRIYIHILKSGTVRVSDLPFEDDEERLKSDVLTFLRSKKWITPQKGGQTFNAMDPDYILDPEIIKIKTIISKLQLALDDFRNISMKDKIIALSTPDKFYKKQRKMIDQARETIYIITDRWRLGWLHRNPWLAKAVKRGVTVRVTGRIFNETTAKRAYDLKKEGIQIGVSKSVSIRFMVVDSESVFFAIRDPQNPDFHLGTLMKSAKFAINLFKEAELVWDKVDKPEEYLKEFLPQ